jgi:hypothetical protein
MKSEAVETARIPINNTVIGGMAGFELVGKGFTGIDFRF